MRNISIEENIIFSELKGGSLALNITATNDDAMINKALKVGAFNEMSFSFELKDILQSIKSGYELGGREKELYLSKHYPLINAYKKELENELKKIERLDFVVNGVLDDLHENDSQSLPKEQAA